MMHGSRDVVRPGLVDELPDVPGLRERWVATYCVARTATVGRCRTRPSASWPPDRVRSTRLRFRQLSADVTLFLHGGPRPPGDELEQLVAQGVAVVEGEVVALEITDDRLSGVRSRSGRVVSRQALAPTSDQVPPG